ncbi:uncharacterized protein LOC143626079 [Bidens hawaiensis]|uniref:uncharacterized protein LOC143626079 n=1 Tax=Bidens hawaiensis TaxID=980011 RepID=UPI00404A323D
MVVLFLLILIQISKSSYANIEGDALYALRRAVKDPTNVLQSWDPTLVDPCTWFHVTCDSENRVTRLDLGNAKLSGNLVPELGKLERLQYLELYMNNFVGTIPSELGGLKNLISLDLFHNNLTGFIPPSLSKLSNIRFMYVSSIFLVLYFVYKLDYRCWKFGPGQYRTSPDSFFANAQHYTQQYAMQRDPPPDLSTTTARTRMTRAPGRLDDFVL